MPGAENISPHKFKKGTSGNPKGRPPGPNAKTIIKKWLLAKEQMKNPISGTTETLTQLDIISLAQLVKARKGDTAAFNALLDRVDGKPKQTTDLTTDGESLNMPVPQIKVYASGPPISTSEEDVAD